MKGKEKMERKQINWRGTTYNYVRIHCYSGEKLPEINFTASMPIVLSGMLRSTLSKVPSNAIVVGIRLIDEDKSYLQEACAEYDRVLVNVMGEPYS